MKRVLEKIVHEAVVINHAPKGFAIRVGPDNGPSSTGLLEVSRKYAIKIGEKVRVYQVYHGFNRDIYKLEQA